MPVILVLRRQRQEDQELKVILDYIAKFKSSLNTCNLSKTKQNKTKMPNPRGVMVKCG